jgi:hypothetical protein
LMFIVFVLIKRKNENSHYSDLLFYRSLLGMVDTICVIDWATGPVGFSATWLAIWDKIWFTSLPAPPACADCEANWSIFWVIWPASAPGFAVAIWVAICSIVWVIDASAVGKVLDVPSGGVVVTFDEYTCARKKLR